MKIREHISGIWLMAMNLPALFAFTCYFVAQMWLDILKVGLYYAGGVTGVGTDDLYVGSGKT